MATTLLSKRQTQESPLPNKRLGLLSCPQLCTTDIHMHDCPYLLYEKKHYLQIIDRHNCHSVPQAQFKYSERCEDREFEGVSEGLPTKAKHFAVSEL